MVTLWPNSQPLHLYLRTLPQEFAFKHMVVHGAMPSAPHVTSPEQHRWEKHPAEVGHVVSDHDWFHYCGPLGLWIYMNTATSKVKLP